MKIPTFEKIPQSYRVPTLSRSLTGIERGFDGLNRITKPVGQMKDPLSACGVVLWLTVLITSGCGSRPAYTFDKLDSVPVQEELTEFSLGHYEIPIPVMDDRDKDRPIVSNRFEFVFDLHVLVAPDEESQIAADWERHEGKVRDLVMAICRGARLEELQEPELATLKSHLTEAVQGQLGSAKVRRLLMTDVDSQEI